MELDSEHNLTILKTFKEMKCKIKNMRKEENIYQGRFVGHV